MGKISGTSVRQECDASKGFTTMKKEAGAASPSNFSVIPQMAEHESTFRRICSGMPSPQKKSSWMALNVSIVAFLKTYHYDMVMGGFTVVGSVPLNEDTMFNKIPVYATFSKELKEAMTLEVQEGGTLYKGMATYGRLDVEEQVNFAFKDHPEWRALTQKKQHLMTKPVNQDYFVVFGCANYHVGRLLSMDLRSADKVLKKDLKAFAVIVTSQIGLFQPLIKIVQMKKTT